MPTALKVVMFTDQVKSTPNTARRTTSEIVQVDRAQDELTAEVVGQCQGTILKDTGDGAFVEFPSCANAVRCGYILQQRLKARNEAQTNDHLRFELHIGIDFGDVLVLQTGDLRGNAPNRAARVCSECPPGEVYFTEKVQEELHPREAQVAKVGAFSLKGVRGKVNIYRLVAWLGDMPFAPNPFVWRAGITKVEDFFDRDNEQRTLRTYLRGRQNCQIVGLRRLGKTSLLLHLERVASTWEDAAVVAYLNLQDPRCYTLSGWLARASRQFGWSTTPTNLGEFTDCIEGMLSARRHPVLCLDEFEQLTLRRTEFNPDFLLTLRACGQLGMSIVTTAQKPLSDLTEPGDLSSPYYNTFPLLRLGPFSSQDAEDFVTVRRSGVSPFTPGEKRAILEVAKGHPLALQVACFHVLEAKESGASLVVAIRRAEEDMSAHLPTW